MRVSGKCGAWLSDVVDGIRWAAGLPVSGVPTNPNPAKVINVSFGGSTTCTPAYQYAIDDAGAVGSLVVVAAGNENGPLTRPADCAGVLAVGAVRQDRLKTYYSNYGRIVGIMAPGGPGGRDVGPGCIPPRTPARAARPSTATTARTAPASPRRWRRAWPR